VGQEGQRPGDRDALIVVVPCYNEAARLDVDAFRRFASQGHPVRLLFVDDGSTDDTPAVLKGLLQADPKHFLLHRLPKNRGKAEAVRAGILRALELGADMVGYWDADLATPLEAIPQFQAFLDANPAVEIVMGARVKLLGWQIERRALRHYLGRVFATVASLTLDLPVYDTQCGAKLLRVTPTTAQLFAEPFSTNWIFDVELLARFLRHRRAAGLPVEDAIYEMPLHQWHEVGGSKVHVSDFFRAFFGLGRIYWRYLRGR
jgi:dolichyl-phosphate beta-glucosyltransferase